MFTTFADGMKLSIMACASERNCWTAQLLISKILWFGVWSHVLLYLRALITTDYSGGSYLDTSVKSAHAQGCCNLWTLSGMYHRRWLVGFLVPFGLLTGTVELLFGSIPINQELSDIVSSVEKNKTLLHLPFRRNFIRCLFWGHSLLLTDMY